jgi:Flp pilus assembly pilin Flp
MHMSIRFMRRFCQDESGAVTVDWVVLTAGIMTLGAVIVASIIQGSTGMSGSVGAELTNAKVPEISFK